MMRPRRPLFSVSRGTISGDRHAEPGLNSLSRALAEDGPPPEELTETQESLHAGWAELVARIRSQETVIMQLTKH